MSPSIRYLVIWLLLPLMLLAIVAIALTHWTCEPITGLLVNLSATFIGAIITVWYVDRVVERHEARQWEQVKIKLANRIERAANVCINSIRTALGVSADVVFPFASDADPKVRRLKMEEMANSVLAPRITELNNLDQKGWLSLAGNLQNAFGYVDQLLAEFALRLEPRLTEALMTLQDRIGSILSSHATFPDIFGVAPNNLPAKLDGSSSISTQRALYEIARRDVGMLLSAAIDVLHCLDDGYGRGTAELKFH